MQGLYPNHMHIFRPWRKHVQSFKKIGIKLYEELRSQRTHCLYIEVEKWQFTKWKKVTKNNLTIMSKPHTHPHTMKKTSAKVQKDQKNLQEELCSQDTHGKCWRMDGQTDGNLQVWQKWPVHQAKTQISLGIRPVWSVFAVRSKDSQGPKASTCRQWRRIRLGRGWAQRSFCWFSHTVAYSLSMWIKYFSDQTPG